ncbi:MAG: cell wall hydrolase [Catonella sp.]|jgi:hypothetical protein|nr:cell wall hydrolase [Catonella sp.]MDY6356821.1 cell wall hydrolase [Catonella sp.]
MRQINKLAMFVVAMSLLIVTILSTVPAFAGNNDGAVISENDNTGDMYADNEAQSGDSLPVPEKLLIALDTHELNRNMTAVLAENKKAAKKKAIAAAKRRNTVKVPGYGITITKTEYEYLVRIVQAEAGYMDESSRRYVASVILNRRESSDFPDDIVSIVTQNKNGTYQFSPVAPGGTFWTMEVTEDTRKSVNFVIKYGDIAYGALYFLDKRAANYKNVVWFDTNLTHLFAWGGHDYYR